MEDVLSQAEVESLLSAMASSSEASLPHQPRQNLRPRGVAYPNGEKVTPYDFKRPERVGKEQMRALQTLHEGFGRNFAAGLSAMLRSMVEVKLTSVDQLTYSEFIFSLENPTCFNLLKADPLEGNLILDINPSILYPIIDRLLGGGKEAGPLARRPLTEIELRLVSRITTLFLDAAQACLGQCSGTDAQRRTRGKQRPTGSDRPAQRSGDPGQLRADTRGYSRDDEPLHSVQRDRAVQREAHLQQLGRLQPRSRHGGDASRRSAGSSTRRVSNSWQRSRTPASPPPN